MSLKLRPYWKDRTRHEVDMQIEHPTTQAPLRKRIAAPAGFDERQARRWGEKELEKWLKALALPTPREEDRKDPEPITLGPQRAELTFEVFYRERFEPNFVRFQRYATQISYDWLWRHHLSALGSNPLRAIDIEAVDKFRSDLKDKGLNPNTINLILSKLKKMLRWALQRKLIAGLPLIEPVKAEPPVRPHYTEEQIAELRTAVAQLAMDDAVVFLLAYECGLRSGEIAALRWEDVNLKKRLVTVRLTIFRGKEGPAKGTIGDVGITNALMDALSRLERRGPRVLYRCSHHTGFEYAQHTEGSLKACLHRILREVGFDEAGLHRLRHSGITFLADRGEDIYTVQAFARHARLSTTERYLHQSKQRLVGKAARAFDGNGPATPGNESAIPAQNGS